MILFGWLINEHLPQAYVSSIKLSMISPSTPLGFLYSIIQTIHLTIVLAAFYNQSNDYRSETILVTISAPKHNKNAKVIFTENVNK